MIRRITRFLRYLLLVSVALFTQSVDFRVVIAQDLVPNSEQGFDQQRSPKIDVEAQVWPILRDRCLRCHGGKTGTGSTIVDGGFRLDTREYLTAGGHTTNKMLGDDGELMRRITSDDEDYRMPKADIPLPETQIQLIRAWIVSGAEWPVGRVLEMRPQVTYSQTRSTNQGEQQLTLDDIVDAVLSIHSKIFEIQYLLIAFLVVMLATEYRRQWLLKNPSAKRNPVNRIAMAASGVHYLAVFLTILLIAVGLYHVRYRQEIIAQLQTARKAAAPLVDRQATAPANMSPEPHRPKHPPRLGGEYYRGNDERSDRLFNGGYYRTATMRLSLRDQNNEPMQWGDRIRTRRVFVGLEIEKAPFTTTDLFTSAILESCHLSPAIPGNETIPVDQSPAYLSEVESGQRWFAQYEIIDLGDNDDRAANVNASGLIYLYNNSTAHFGIRYDVHLQDSIITHDSVLWMGAILLPGGAVTPPQDAITLREWFDFLPIPEITEPNSEDPVLLGIPEHLQKQKK